MKLKKLFVPLLTACMAVTASVGLAACGGQNGGRPEGGETTITYQFTGNFTNETLSGFGFDYYVLLNLNSDGKITGSGYNCLSMDSRTASENTGFAEKWFRGTWENAKNQEDQDCVKIKAIYDADAKNSMTGANLSNTSEYYVLKKPDGSLADFRLQTPIFSGTTEYMTRMKQNKTPYKDADAFITASLFVESLPTDYKAVFEPAADSSMKSKIYLLEGGNAELYSGKKVPGSETYKYAKGETWKWSYAAGVLKIGEYTATVNGTSAILEYTVNLMGNAMTYKYTCADISGLGEMQQPVPVPEPILTFTGNGATLEFYDKNVAKLSAFGGMLKPEFVWSVKDGEIILTDKENSEKTYTSVTESGVTKIIYNDSLGGNPVSIELTCNDVSAIVPLATLATTDGKTACFYKNGTLKIDTGIAQLSPEWRWTYLNGTITLKEKENDNTPGGATITISGDNAILTYAPSFMQGQSFTYSGSVAALITE